MKKLIISLLAVGAIALTGYSQTDTNTAPTGKTLWDFATTGSNYWVAPFMTYSLGSHDFGGGVAAGYRVTKVINPVLRLDDFAHQLYVVSGNLQIQPPRTLMGKIPITPFGLAGVATALGGNGVDNGKAIGVLGAGAYFEWSHLSPNSWLGQHCFTAADYEYWSGLPSSQTRQIRVTFVGMKF